MLLTSLIPGACSPAPQFGNTCYCNSVLQALYYCAPFRERVLACGLGEDSASLLTHLAELFRGIDLKKKRGSLTLLRRFIVRLRKENGGRGRGCRWMGVFCCSHLCFVYGCICAQLRSVVCCLRAVQQSRAARCPRVPQLPRQHSGRSPQEASQRCCCVWLLDVLSL